eukprot:IDg7116t1
MRGVSAFAAAAGVPGSKSRLRGRAVCSQVGPRMAVETATHTLNGRSITGPLKPAGNNVLVKVAEAPEETAGGLILSSSAKEKPTHGLAVAVGDGKFLGAGIKVPMAISQGDTVLYGKTTSYCLLANGEYAAEAVRPIFDRVLVKRDDSPSETASGIALGKSAERPTSGRVVAVGPGRFMENGETEPLSFQAGDVVMFGKYSGTEVTFRGEEYMLLRVADVFAMWE